MYPEQIKIINSFTEKFDSTQYGITKFIRNNRIKKAPEEKMCTNEIHRIRPGMTLYLFNGKPYGLKSHYCCDMKCFLENIDEKSVKIVKEKLQTKEKSFIPVMEKSNEDNYNQIKN